MEGLDILLAQRCIWFIVLHFRGSYCFSRVRSNVQATRHMGSQPRQRIFAL
jgi:hypothetical protein